MTRENRVPITQPVVTVLGGGNWGTVLAQLAAAHAREVRLWIRDEETARAVGATRQHPGSAGHGAEMKLHERIRPVTELAQCFEREGEFSSHVLVWALPAQSCRSVAKEAAKLLRGDEILIHATKGLEAGTLKRMSQVLREELPIRKVGVLSGPNLAGEIARGSPAVTVIASPFSEVAEIGKALFASSQFQVLASTDLAGVEWVGALKNVYAIIAGAFDALNVGSNSRAWMLCQALQEMSTIARAFGREGILESTLLGPAGMGDLLATAASPQSRNYRVGQELARGTALTAVLEGLGSVAEGVETARKIDEQATHRKIVAPLVRATAEWLGGRSTTPVFIENVLRLDPASR